MGKKLGLAGFCSVLIIVFLAFNLSRATRGRPYFIGSFTPKAAMTRVFGNFDNSKQSSVWTNVALNTLPRNRSGNAIRQVFGAKERAEGLVNVYGIFQPTDATRYLFFTAVENDKSATESSGECHACGVVLGGAVFERHGIFWTLQETNLFLGVIGSWGKAPEEGRLMQWSEGNYGLMVIDQSGGK